METRVVVYHGDFGCDTGCCGHYVRMHSDHSYREKFEFGHPEENEDPRSWARTLIEETFGMEHTADLDWDECVIVNDGECPW